MVETNVIYNEDCLEGMKNLPDNSIDLVITDPPYNANYGFDNDNLAETKFYNFAEKWIRQCERVTKNGIIFIVDTRYCLPFYKIPNIKFHHTYTHFKNNAMRGMPGGYANKTEIICYTNKKPNKIQEFPNDVWAIPIKAQNISHPTPKPIKLIDVILQKFTNENEIILDPFMGSGTTAVSCLKNNRQFIGYEIKEEYYYESLTRIGKFDKSYYEQLPEEEKPKQQQLF